MLNGLSRFSRATYGGLSVFLGSLLVFLLAGDQLSPMAMLFVTIVTCLSFLAIFSLVHVAIRRLFFLVNNPKS